jgi:hypothetical protein
MIKEIRKSIYGEEIFEQNSYYYLCDIMDGMRTETCLSEQEEELGYELEYVAISNAIKANSAFAGIEKYKFIERETTILNSLQSRESRR